MFSKLTLTAAFIAVPVACGAQDHAQDQQSAQTDDRDPFGETTRSKPERTPGKGQEPLPAEDDTADEEAPAPTPPTLEAEESEPPTPADKDQPVAITVGIAPPEDSPVSEATVVTDDVDPGFVEAVLPFTLTYDCELELPPTLCEWATSVDAVFRAEIVELKPVTTEFMTVTQDGRLQTENIISECPFEDATFALSLSLRNLQTLYGDAPLGPIEVRVAPIQLVEWKPSYDGRTQPDRFPADAESGLEPLAPGSVIGVAATRVMDGAVWSLMMAPPFTFSADGALRLPVTNTCSKTQQMPAIGGLGYEDLQRSLDLCTSDPTGKDERLRYWSEPHKSFASVCRVGNE